jgi:hypothetical protein
MESIFFFLDFWGEGRECNDGRQIGSEFLAGGRERRESKDGRAI